MLRPLKKSLSIVKKVVIVFVVLFTAINLLLYFSSDRKPTAYVDVNQQSRNEIYKVLGDLEKKNTPQSKVFASIYKMTTCKVIGEACSDNPADGDKNYNGSVVGKMGNLLAMPYANPPASGVYWTIAGLQNAGFIPKTYAAEGIGFGAIKPLAGIWKVLRDFAYIVLVIILVIIGFMVMFRMKLNPQTVISVESALPRIVMALIGITFSFAIAGFLIDFMYVLIVIGVSVLAKADPKLSATALQNQYVVANFGSIWDSMFPLDNGWFSRLPIVGGLSTLISLGSAITGLLPSWINDSVRTLAGLIWLKTLFNWIMDPGGWGARDLSHMFNNLSIFGNSTGELAKAPLSMVLSITVFFILFPITIIFGASWLIGIIMLFTMLLLLFRIFFMLFTGYLKILLLIALGPLFMMIEAIPGKNAFSFWFKSLLVELLAFPTVIFLLVFGRVIVNVFAQPNSTIWQPPFLYGIDAKNFSILLGMGIIFMIPDLVKLLRELLGIKGLPFGLQLGTFFGGASAGVGGGMGMLSQIYSINMGVSTITGKGVRDLLGFAPKETLTDAERAEALARRPKPAEPGQEGGGH